VYIATGAQSASENFLVATPTSGTLAVRTEYEYNSRPGQTFGDQQRTDSWVCNCVVVAACHCCI